MIRIQKKSYVIEWERTSPSQQWNGCDVMEYCDVGEGKAARQKRSLLDGRRQSVDSSRYRSSQETLKLY